MNFNDPNRVIRKTSSDKEVEAFQRLIYTELGKKRCFYVRNLVKKCIKEIRPREIFNQDKEGTFEVGIKVD
jgi:hypothetical protein